jgi:asparagine synthase (glutamine-hydrolysing)
LPNVAPAWRHSACHLNVPGIAGIFSEKPDSGRAEQQVQRMIRTMLHSRSYSHGTLSLPEQGCYLGWVTHPNTYADCNPIVSPDGDVVIIFSGEHFAHSTNGHGNTPGRATELLGLYEKRGERFVEDLNGFFSGIVVDTRQKFVLLFNDRFGMGRVYCHEGQGELTFASEAKAILSVRPETRALDAQGLAQFLGVGTAFNNRTLFANVTLLPSGSCWKIDPALAIDRRQYFHPRAWTEQPRLEPRAFYNELRQTMSRVLPAYFRAAEPVGLSLTGGLDTRIVMAGMPVNGVRMPAYTYGGVYRDCFDIHVAREVAQACGQTHHVLGLGPDFFQNFGTLAEETVWLTDGSLDLCGTHEIYFSRLARGLSTVRLTGNYGSEVLRSVSTFKFGLPSETLFDRGVLKYTADASRAFAEVRAEHPVTFSAFKEVPWNLYGRFAAAQTQLVLRSPYMDNDVVALMYQAPPNTRETNETSLRLIADLNPTLARIGTDMGYGGLSPAPVARMRQFYRYLLFKAEWYYNAGMPQWVARYERMLPLRVFEPLFLGRHKIDHYRLWLQGQAKQFVSDILTDPKSASRSYLNRAGFAEVVDAHVSGRGNSLNAINKTVTLELVQRHLIERPYES